MIEMALIAQTLVVILVTVAFVSTGTASMFHPLTLYLVFHSLVFVMRPILVHGAGFDNAWLFMGYWPDAQQFVFTLIVSSVALIAFSLACASAGHVRPDLSKARTFSFDRTDIVAFLITTALLAPLAIYSAIQRQGADAFSGTGDIQMERDPMTGQPVYTNTTGYIAEAHSMGLPLTLGIIWVSRFHPLSFIPFIAFVGFRAYLGWGRWAIIMGILGLVLLMLYRTRTRWFRLWHVAVGLPVLAIFTTLGNNRGALKDVITGDAPFSSIFRMTSHDGGRMIDALANQDLANFDFLAFILWVVPGQSATYTYFTQYLQLFTEPIPRVLWPGKPVGAPIKWVQLHDFGNFANLTTSLPGDGWMSGGWLGLIVTMAVVGLILGKLHRWFWTKGFVNRYGVLFYCAFLPLSLQWFRDGNITIVKFSFFSLLPILLWIGLTRALHAWGILEDDPLRPGAPRRVAPQKLVPRNIVRSP
ncbi:O-antigen polymerase [Azospirillum thermophilum]|uniref:O-antigen polymerase n=1 Tax=Azospirillum thermophilum TaxID=2202148 RepID=UPI001FE7D926|nr:O-antigen polymerase [Azospirillum thermophilum]